jgi:hypothetical protein
MDTSGLLDGWRRYYPVDVFPSLWRSLDEFIDRGEIFCSEEVYAELSKQDDDIHEWIKSRKQMLIAPDRFVQDRVKQLLATYPRLVDPLRNRSQADPFVIATAMVRSATVVTGEGFGSAQKPRIPFVCEAEKIPCINFLQMIRELRLEF